MKKSTVSVRLALLGALCALHCSSNNGTTADLATSALTASADIKDKDGVTLGSARFAQGGDGKVAVSVTVSKVAPGKHGLHIHETGKCDAPDFTSAGGHFNPNGHDHGAPNSANNHVGDFGNLEAMVVGADGTGQVALSVDSITLRSGMTTTIIGKAIILHAAEDDLKTQPTGNSGARLGCGVINAAQ